MVITFQGEHSKAPQRPEVTGTRSQKSSASRKRNPTFPAGLRRSGAGSPPHEAVTSAIFLQRDRREVPAVGLRGVLH